MSRQSAVTVLLLLIGLVNFAPVMGLLGAARLDSLYGFGTLEGDLLTLMQHRALLFGILGGFILCAAFKRHLQPAAMLLALVSMAGFIVLVGIADAPGAALKKVALVDVFACILLLAAYLLYRRTA